MSKASASNAHADLMLEGGGIFTPVPPITCSSVNTPSPLAAGTTRKRKSLTVQTNRESPASFDFSELDKVILDGGSGDNSPKHSSPLLKSNVSPTCSPNSFIQRYNIFNSYNQGGGPTQGGLGSWANIHHQLPLSSIDAAQNDLTPFILETETRALVLFHPPGITQLAIRTACQKFGVLYYLKSNFHSKGVTFFGYFDIRSSISAHAKLAKLLSSPGNEVAIHYSVMLGESFNDSDAKLTLNNVGSDVTESKIQTVFGEFGALSSIQRKFTILADSPTEKMKKEQPSLCEFSIEYFDIQDAKKAFDVIQSSVRGVFGSLAALNPSPLGKRWQSMLQKLTELLLSWKAALISQGIECNSPVTWTGMPKKFFTINAERSTCSDENSDPAAGASAPSALAVQPSEGSHGPVASRRHAALTVPESDRGESPPGLQSMGPERRRPGYRSTELGLVEITPPDSPVLRNAQSDKPIAYFSTEDPAFRTTGTVPAEAFHNYRQKLLLEHQKLLKMQEAILESLPPDSYYGQPYSRPSHHHHEEKPIGREADRMAPAGGSYSAGGQGYYRGEAVGWRGPGHEYYGDGAAYEAEEEWHDQGYGQSHYAPHHTHNSYPQHRSDNRGHLNHQGRWQNGPGGRSGPQRDDYSYDRPGEYDRYRSGPRHHGGRYAPPAHFSGNHAGGYPTHRTGGNYSYGNPSMGDPDGRYDQKWVDRDQQDHNKANASFIVRVEAILSGADSRATIMVKNIPNKYSQAMLLDEINSKQGVSYDFFYLPMDFKNRCNVGYAFINFTDQNDVVVFFSLFHGRKWDHFNSEKICAVTYARIQGKQSLVSRYQNSSLLDREESYKPLLFYSRGHPLEGQPEPFPAAAGGSKPQNRGGYSGTGHY